MSRPAYRKKGEPPAVRVYTVCDESRYLVVRNVPALGCIDELVKLFGVYGPIEEYRLLDEEECEPFTDVYWIKFVHISNARFAKRKLDEYKFLGNLLQVTYAPEYETLLDTKEKLEERRHVVLNRINSGKPRGMKPQVNSPVEPDPLLEPFVLPGSVGQYPKFPLQQITSKTEDINTGASGSSQCQNKSAAHGTPSKQYFSSPSMNATVQSVREKLDKISSVSVQNQSDTYTQQLVGKEKFCGNAETSSAVKKPRHDNRRRI
eukprot:Gb_33918 [translate_table: standard]